MNIKRKKRDIELLKEKDIDLYNKIKTLMENLPSKECGFSQNDLAKCLSLSKTVAREVVRQARQYGMPICSSFTGGYWKTYDIKELKKQVEFFDLQAWGLTKTSIALGKTLRRFKRGDYKTI